MNKIRLANSLYFSGIFILLFVVFISLFFFLFYIHETGHIIFGLGGGLLKGHINTFTISSQINHPLFNFIPLPQQTKIINGNGSANFILGGSMFMMSVFFVISLFAYLRSKNPAWFLLFFSIALFEISGNFICGTDNFTGNPLPICNHNLDISLQFLAIALFSGTFSYFVSRGLGRKLGEINLK